VVGLLDVNHNAAIQWFTEKGNQGRATWAVTESGVIRVCAQLPGGPWSPETTADRLLLLSASSRAYEFWPDAIEPAGMAEIRTARTAGQITDRYLLGLAQRHDGRVITFDSGLAGSAGNDAKNLLP
jgi:predicted nucleic acid-binding protein